MLNTALTGLPLGIFECPSNKWKHPRRVCRPVFTTMNLKKVMHLRYANVIYLHM